MKCIFYIAINTIFQVLRILFVLGKFKKLSYANFIFTQRFYSHKQQSGKHDYNNAKNHCYCDKGVS